MDPQFSLGPFVSSMLGTFTGSLVSPRSLFLCLLCGALGYNRTSLRWPLLLATLLTAYEIIDDWFWEIFGRSDMWMGGGAWRLYGYRIAAAYFAYLLVWLANDAPTKPDVAIPQSNKSDGHENLK